MSFISKFMNVSERKLFKRVDTSMDNTLIVKPSSVNIVSTKSYSNDIPFGSSVQNIKAKELKIFHRLASTARIAYDKTI